ncbi:prepilin-type N-terminal cleavage/methylation domain-containing protein [Clostridium sp. SYSU_GA19001]|uniref:prepilin-type N-terminal cleavage/methylation domain-containing protein n=1 Tax=Clostridium caldaquaticum TaxID=2940653 RepID=UPI0020779B7C|nr:prepilin-type N-terminal cleavage/methylation domain-containing protein [Clostridium caldaquaticum]MCM8711026.1 prepilin-type N-terminal cleavage/methylation domain-containing protein [Clostridium caldaquaticum]
MKVKKGFTLIEVIIAVSIVVILASLTVPKVSGYIEKAKNTKAISMGKEIYSAAMWSYSEQESSFSNKSNILNAINDVTGVQGLTSDSITIADSKNVSIKFTNDNNVYVININANTSGYTIMKDDTLIFNSNQ